MSIMKPRFNFTSVLIGSKFIIAGGIGSGFKLIKDYQEIELDQSKIIIKKVATGNQKSKTRKSKLINNIIGDYFEKKLNLIN